MGSDCHVSPRREARKTGHTVRKPNSMDTENNPLVNLAQNIGSQFDSIHERTQPLVEAIADSTVHERAMLVATVEIGYGVEELDHIALQSLGVSPPICRAQT